MSKLRATHGKAVALANPDFVKNMVDPTNIFGLDFKDGDSLKVFGFDVTIAERVPVERGYVTYIRTIEF